MADWEQVDMVSNFNFSNRYELKKFAFKGGQRICSAIKLDIKENHGDNMTQLHQLIIYT